MNIIQGVMSVNGRPRNGVTAKLWKAEGFSTPPVVDTTEPSSAYQVGSSIVTGPAYGGEGAYRFTDIRDGDYYVSLTVGSTIVYEGHSIHGAGEITHRTKTQTLEYALCQSTQEINLLDVEGAGVVRQIFVALSSPTKAVVEDESLIKVWVNGEASPSINCPISQFWAWTHEAEPFWTQRFAVTRKDYPSVGATYDRGAYRYLNIPYATSIRISMAIGASDKMNLWTAVYYDDTTVAQDYGRENALKGVYLASDAVAPFTQLELLDVTGRGRLDTLIMSLENADGLQVLEGNLEIYIDGETVPSYNTPGTEDITGNAFYFGPGDINGPYQGAPVHVAGPPAKITQYRIFDLDAVDFETRLRVVWSVGHKGQGAALAATTGVKSTIFYYLDTQPTAVSELGLTAQITEKFDSYGNGVDIGLPWVQWAGGDKWRQEAVGVVYDSVGDIDAWMYHNGSNAWTDYVVEADVKINNHGTGEFWIFARGTTTPVFNTRITFGLSKVGAEPEHPNYQPVFLFVASGAGSESTLLKLPSGVEHTLRLEVSGGLVICSVKPNGETAFREMFRHVQSARNDGYAGISTVTGDVECSEFRVLRRAA